jgi:catalase
MPSTRYRLPSPADIGSTIRLAIIGILILIFVASFADVAGWLSPHRLTPTRIVDGFELVNGVHPGFRRNHAKGVCVSGYFDSNGAGARLSRADVFKPGRVPLIGRVSLAGGNPYAADGPAAIRAIAIALRPLHGQEWRMATIDLPVFPVRTPRAFYEQLLSSRPDPVTGMPDPNKMKAFLAGHPETARALTIIKAEPFSSGFDNATYYSLNAFRFVNAAGDSTPVRWSIVPVDPFEPQNPVQSATQAKNYLFDALIARIHHGPLQWHLIVTIGQPGDHTDDATIPWPRDRAQIDVGTFTIDRIEGEAHGACRDINFDPLVLPDGIAPSDDPLLSARSAVYSQSFTRRAGERKSPSAIRTRETGSGS